MDHKGDGRERNETCHSHRCSCCGGKPRVTYPRCTTYLRQHEEQHARTNGFYSPSLAVFTPLTLFGNVKKSKDGLDIKRGGIFPIVHGIRALSLEYALIEKNTFDRIEALQKKRILEPDTADNLTEALKLFFKLRLAQQLSEHHSGNNIELKLLDRSERDLLRHSLHVVKKFKQWLGYHYQIRD